MSETTGNGKVRDVTAAGPVRAMIADDDEIIVKGLAAMLGPFSGRVRVVGHALMSDDIAGRASQLGADVVLVDVRVQGGADGLEVAARLVAGSPPFRVVVFTDLADERHLFQALRLDVSGYLLRSLSGSQLAGHLERVRGGELVVDPRLGAHAARTAARVDNGRVWPGAQRGLSHRESEVLGLLVDGLANRDIATELLLGEETVKSHLRAVYRKLGVRHRAQAVSTALRQGIYR
ncbi:MAG: LuxR C-terminal-related transcriptional regulator [Acidimicrobiales bacterium]